MQMSSLRQKASEMAKQSKNTLGDLIEWTDSRIFGYGNPIESARKRLSSVADGQLVELKSIEHSFSVLGQTLKSFFWLLLSKSSTRWMLAYFALNVVVMFLEIIVGYLSNSVGLLSDAGHMLNDNVGIFIGMLTDAISSWEADGSYTYGYRRHGVLSGFVQSVLLVGLAIQILFESVSRIITPEELHHDHLFATSVLGLVVNAIGLAFFHDHAYGGCNHAHGHADKPKKKSGHGHSHKHGEKCNHGHKKKENNKGSNGGHGHSHKHGEKCNHGHKKKEAKGGHGHSHKHGEKCNHGHKKKDANKESKGGHGHSHKHGKHCNHGKSKKSKESKRSANAERNENAEAMFNHVLADLLGSVGVVISTIVTERYGWLRADPICSLIISGLIFQHAVPLMKSTAEVLLLKTPDAVLQDVESIYKEIRAMDGVEKIENNHVWQLHSGKVVGSLQIRISPDMAGHPSMKNLLNDVAKSFAAIGVEDVTAEILPRKQVVVPPKQLLSTAHLSHRYPPAVTA